MDLERLQALVTAVDEGSLSRASRALGCSPRVLRRRIDELEQQVGVTLLEGSGHDLTWTASAKLLAREGKALLSWSETLRGRMRSGASELVGEYRFAYPTGSHPDAVAFIMSQVLKRFPKLRLKATPALDPMALLPERADMAVYIGSRPPEGAWLSATVQRLEECVLASRDYIERHGPIESLEELRAHCLLSWDPPDGDADRWPLRDGGSFFVQSSLVTRNIALLRRAIAEGTGVARVPYGGLPKLSPAGGDFVPVLPERLGREISLVVTMPDTPKMRQLFLLLSGVVRGAYEEFRG
ncbi:MAG: LysR family transcriptional regulator [Myxococcota bacterium]